MLNSKRKGIAKRKRPPKTPVAPNLGKPFRNKRDKIPRKELI